jgi:hypothetical protein
MSLHFINIRCEDCGTLFSVRRPRKIVLIASIVALVKCPICHPANLAGMCAGCRLPLSILKNGHGKGEPHVSELCFSCYQRERRSSALLSETS